MRTKQTDSVQVFEDDGIKPPARVDAYIGRISSVPLEGTNEFESYRCDELVLTIYMNKVYVKATCVLYKLGTRTTYPLGILRLDTLSILVYNFIYHNNIAYVYPTERR